MKHINAEGYTGEVFYHKVFSRKDLNCWNVIQDGFVKGRKSGTMKKKRIKKILSHPLYLEKMKVIREIEKGMEGCGHNEEHALTVARIAYIRVLKKKWDVSKEELYAAAYLHDIGKAAQELGKKSHAVYSVVYAEPILKDCGFDVEESKRILGAIREHTNKKMKKDKSISGALFYGDKHSRPCEFCSLRNSCRWKYKNTSMKAKY